MDQPIHLYDNGRIACTLDDKATAAHLSGHTWNIINNRKDHEVYLRHARNNDHYITEEGRTTNAWFEQKRRVVLPNGSIRNALSSEHVAEVMRCPPTAGKEAAKVSMRQARHECQASAPMDFGQYSARREEVPPPTPAAKPDSFDRCLQWPGRRRDPPERTPARLLTRQSWTPRRGELRDEPLPPPQALHTARRRPADAGPVSDGFSARGPSAGAAVVAAPLSARTPLRERRPAHSLARMEDICCREISAWALAKDKLKHGDGYFEMPAAQQSASGVNYNILNHQRTNFWY